MEDMNVLNCLQHLSDCDLHLSVYLFNLSKVLQKTKGIFE